MKTIKYYFSIALGVLGAGFYLALAKPGSKAWGTVAQSYAARLAQEEQALFAQFFKIFNITPEIWQNYKDSCKEPFFAYENNQIARANSEATQQLSPELARVVDRAIADSGIDRSIDVYSDVMTHAIHNGVFINEPELNELNNNPTHMHATILHEMQHLIYQDLYVGYCLETLKAQAMERCPDFDLAQYNELMRQWYLFREKRADLMAGCTHPTCAKAMAEFWQSYIERYGDNDGAGTHPKPSDRLAYCQALESQMTKFA
jgi:hypothetical protein